MEKWRQQNCDQTKPEITGEAIDGQKSTNNQRIGDIIVKFSPFFKMYTEYVKNFDNAISNINNYYAKNSKFAAIMDEIHVRKYTFPS